MGFRFRKRIRIAPGIHLNLGKKGINSVSLGAGPFTTNVNKEGVKHTAGLHGSGLSYETKRSPWADSERRGMSSGSKKALLFIAVLFIIAYLIH